MRHYAYACCKDDQEYALVTAAARAEGLSVSNFVRRCINAYLVELSEDGPLLDEQDGQRGRPRKTRQAGVFAGTGCGPAEGRRGALMDAGITAWYLATVWMGRDPYDVGTRTVVRLQALDVDDYKARVQALWPEKRLEFGPVGLSTVQG